MKRSLWAVRAVWVAILLVSAGGTFLAYRHWYGHIGSSSAAPLNTAAGVTAGSAGGADASGVALSSRGEKSSAPSNGRSDPLAAADGLSTTDPSASDPDGQVLGASQDGPDEASSTIADFASSTVENVPVDDPAAVATDTATDTAPIDIFSPDPGDAEDVIVPIFPDPINDGGTNNATSSGSVSVIPAPDPDPSQDQDILQAPDPISDPAEEDIFLPTSTIDVATSILAEDPEALTPGLPKGVIFEQLDDTAQSPVSWYDDNWFVLGNGFAGTLKALTLEGKASDVHYGASHVWLQEFKDPGYTAMIQQFTISDDAPFTDVMATATFDGLSIRLKPYLYYRLATSQDFQNRSVILAGTSDTAVGVVMSNAFIYGAGRVESTSTYFPYLIMKGTPASSSTLSAPLLTTPKNFKENFGGIDMMLNPSFTNSTDPDWPDNPLHYEINYSTSTLLSDEDWQPLASIAVTMGNSYTVGLRARDDFGNFSDPVVIHWSFPAGFSPYILSPQLSSASQSFTVKKSSTLQSVMLFTTHLQSGARNWDGLPCSLSFSEIDDGSGSGTAATAAISSDNTIYGYSCEGDPLFSFASSSFELLPGHHYLWTFQIQTGNPSTGASVQFYGTTADTAHGVFSDPSLANARFIVYGDSGALFSN